MIEEVNLRNEIETERTPKELNTWVEAKIASIDDEKWIFGQGLFKQIKEEILPLAIFADKKFANNQLIKLHPVLGNQNYDAIVIDSSVNPPNLTYVEITQAHEGEIVHDRALYLQKHGFAPITGLYTKTGTKRTGIEVSADFKAEDVNNLVQREIDRILKAIKKKENKKYRTNTWLVVMFNDDHLFLEYINKKTIDSVIKNSIVGLKLRFQELYLVGWKKNRFHQYKVERKQEMVDDVISF
jgi:hypothetical protein